MKGYRNNIIIFLILCTVSFFYLVFDALNVFSLLFSTNSSLSLFVAQNRGIILFANNIMLGIFTSAFVVMLTYICVYRIERSNVVGLVKHYCGEYILELSNLLPKLFLITEERKCIVNWEALIKKIKTDVEIHSSIGKLLYIHDQRILTVDGYFPFLRKNKNNLEVHYLICLLAKLNGVIQYCDYAYNLENNIIFKLDKNDDQFKYSEDMLRDQLRMLVPTYDNEYSRFINLFEKVTKRNKSASVYNSKWEEKCS